MGKWYESNCAMCCFYKGEGSHRIVCEGMYESSNVHVSFPSRAVLEEHKKKYCYSWGYENCPLAKALAEIYEDEEDEEADADGERPADAGE